LQQTYFNKQLVLIGGGHANVQVLRKLCMSEYMGLNIILISEDYKAIYSGMTPGYIKKFYSLEDISIDLQRLCFNAGATFIKDVVINLDTQNQNRDWIFCFDYADQLILCLSLCTLNPPTHGCHKCILIRCGI